MAFTVTTSVRGSRSFADEQQTRKALNRARRGKTHVPARTPPVRCICSSPCAWRLCVVFSGAVHTLRFLFSSSLPQLRPRLCPCMMSGAATPTVSGGMASASAKPAHATAAAHSLEKEMQRVEALIIKHQQALDKLDAEMEKAEEDAAGSEASSPALLSMKQRALELQIKLTQDKIREVELQLKTAPTPEKEAALQQKEAALQREKILLLEAQQRAQQPSASGECALCLHTRVASMAPSC